MAIVRWDPFREISTMQRSINRLFDDAMRRQDGEGVPALTGTWVPAVDIVENEESITLQAELPGMTREDVSISIDGSNLSISGERKRSQEIKEENYHRIERSYGTFVRSFSLPSIVDREKISAKMSDGILEILMPKSEEAKPRQIDVAVD